MANPFGTTINPVTPRSYWSYITSTSSNDPQQNFATALQQAVLGNPYGNTVTPWNQLLGLPKYQGPLSPQVNPTLQNSWSNWQPWNAGNSYMASWLGGGQPGSAPSNIQQYGGVGGVPTAAMNAMLQYGTPSQAGQPMSLITQYGVPGQGGLPMYNLATGGPSAATSYLSPFMSPLRTL